MTNKQQERSAFLLSLASYVDGIREGWRRMRGGEPPKKATDSKTLVVKDYEEQENKPRDNMVVDDGAKREMTLPGAQQKKARGSITSFEKFLCSLPRVDAVDRTVDWVLAQPDDIEEMEANRFANLTRHGLSHRYRKLHHVRQISEEPNQETDTSAVSWSRYESERGTMGRGTPPTLREDRPRLDLLLQHLHQHQEKKAVTEMRPRIINYTSTLPKDRGKGEDSAHQPVYDLCNEFQDHPFPHHHHHHHHHQQQQQRPGMQTGINHRLLTTTNVTTTTKEGRRPPNPKMTMVTGLQIKAAIPVSRKRHGTKEKSKKF